MSKNKRDKNRIRRFAAIFSGFLAGALLLLVPILSLADQRPSFARAVSADLGCLGNKRISGKLLDKYKQLGGCNSVLGAPRTGMRITSDRKSRYVDFQHGSIYQNPGSQKTVEVHGAIFRKWNSLGREKGVLGYPVTDEKTAPDKKGKYSHFQFGSIYYHPSTGNAFEMHGEINKLWAKLGYERGPLGYPVSDETATPDGIGRFNHFQHGSIYWTPGTGAHEVYGAIHKHWASIGYEKSVLGYPVSGERSEGKKTRYSVFQNGVIYWSPSGIHIVRNSDNGDSKIDPVGDPNDGKADPF